MNNLNMADSEQDLLSEDSFDIRASLMTLWLGKFKIIGFTSACAIAAIFYSLSLPNIYTSSAILKVNDNSNSQSSMLSQYSGIASMAGISLPTQSDNKMQYAIQTLKSKEFVKYLLKEDMFIPNLMAVKEYDSVSKSIVYDEKVYIENNNKWIRETSQGRSIIPSHIEVFDLSYNPNYQARKDMKSGFLYVSFSHQSPDFSYTFLNKTIEVLNRISREKDLKESQDALDYLYDKLSEPQQKEVLSSINALIESQLKTQMLGNIRDDYLVSIIDPPFYPENKSSPKRSQIVVLATILGLMASILFVFVSESIFVRQIKNY